MLKRCQRKSAQRIVGQTDKPHIIADFFSFNKKGAKKKRLLKFHMNGVLSEYNKQAHNFLYQSDDANCWIQVLVSLEIS